MLCELSYTCCVNCQCYCQTKGVYNRSVFSFTWVSFITSLSFQMVKCVRVKACSLITLCFVQTAKKAKQMNNNNKGEKRCIDLWTVTNIYNITVNPCFFLIDVSALFLPA